MKHALAILAALLACSPSQAETGLFGENGPLGKTRDALIPYMRELHQDVSRELLRGSAYDPILFRQKRNGATQWSTKEPLELKKPLEKCMKPNHVIDEEVVECMQGR
jgi:hypothetical protein